MRITIRNLGLLLVLILLAGCASARLGLDLAVYKEDPLPRQLVSPEQIDAMIDALDTIAREAESFANSRKKLGADLVGVITAFSELRGQALAKSKGQKYTSEQAAKDQRIYRGYLPRFNQAVDMRLAEVKARTDKAKAALMDYRILLAAPEHEPKKGKEEGAAAASVASATEWQRLLAAQFAARDAVEMVPITVKKLTGNLGTNLEKSIRRDPARWAKVMTPQVFQQYSKDPKAQGEVKKLAEQLQTLQTTIKEIDAKGNGIAKQVEKQLTKATAMLTPTNQPSTLNQTVNEIASALTAIPDSIQFSDDGRQAIADITRRSVLLASQIERLQNPADPVWRIVTDPVNAGKWNESFSRTYFYAEGKTSVVVVRDSPMDFRVQQGANNPAALVQAQLRVSRAIGNAALAVAGAATGVNLAAFAPQAQTIGEDGKLERAESDAEKLAQRQATVSQQRAFRAATVRGLEISLRNFRVQLSDPNVGNRPADAKAIIDNMVNVLRGYQKVFQADPKM